MADYLRANGKMTKDMGGDTKDILMEIYTKASSNTERLTVKADISGRLRMRYMMANGLKA